MLLSRQRPALPLARLYAQGQVDVITAADLSFTQEEVHAYLLRQGFPAPSAEDVAQLTGRSDGWITAIRLAVLALQKSPDLHRLLTALHGNNSWLADFLTDEVLSKQTPRLHRFLLQTSILDSFNAELCATVTGIVDAYQALAESARADLFMIPLETPGWYRYHHLFQEMLQHRLMTQHPAGTVADLHRRAAAWLAGADQPRGAVQHLLQAGANVEAAALVERSLRSALANDLYQARALLALCRAQWLSSTRV
ncbi:MAG: hypothetical protein IPK16_17925 [Anaerolineales bacterium]|nr:hypothetical protein [Anaerolineales bacterium]